HARPERGDRARASRRGDERQAGSDLAGTARDRAAAARRRALPDDAGGGTSLQRALGRAREAVPEVIAPTVAPDVGGRVSYGLGRVRVSQTVLQVALARLVVIWIILALWQ